MSNTSVLTFTKHDGSEMSREPKGVKVRIAETLRRPTQRLSNPDPADPGIMQEISKLTDKDLADFTAWFNAAGYPIATA